MGRGGSKERLPLLAAPFSCVACGGETGEEFPVTSTTLARCAACGVIQPVRLARGGRRGNAYADAFHAVNGDGSGAIDPIIVGAYVRAPLTERFGYAIPTTEAIDVLVELGPVVEIGAGGGYWASLVAEVGGVIDCYDVAPWPNAYYHISIGGPEVLARHGAPTLFLSWPPLHEPMASDALTAFRGDRLVYIGEWRGGCTADDKFFDILDEEWEFERAVRLPNWAGMHDVMNVFRRR